MPTSVPSPNSITTPNVTNTTSVQVVGANVSRAALIVFNPNAANDLWIAPTGVTATVNGAGSFKIAALTSQTFAEPPWTQGMNAIASAGGTNAITLYEFYD